MANGKIKISILLIFLTLFGCASSPPSMKKSMGDCDVNIETTFSAGDTIRFKYSIDKQADVNILAENWCSDRGKSAKKNTQSCKGCCVATYRCSSK